MSIPESAVEAAAKAIAKWDGAAGWDTPEWDGEISEESYRHGGRAAVTPAAPIIRAQAQDDDAAYLDAKWSVHHEELRHASPYGQLDERGSGFVDGYETAIRDLDARAKEERQ